MDFSKVEAEFKKLKGQFEAGALTEAEIKARLADLMIQDEQGRWWMIGYETGQWYYHDGEKWVRGELPQIAEQRLTKPPVVARPSPSTNRLAIFALVSGVLGLVAIPTLVPGADVEMMPTGGGIMAVMAILALVLGYNARNDIHQHPSETSGENWATAGIMLGWIDLAVLCLCAIIYSVRMVFGLSG